MYTHTHTIFVKRLEWSVNEDVSFSTGFMFVSIVKYKSLKYVCECVRVSGRRREIPTVKSRLRPYKSVFTCPTYQSPTSTSLSDPKQPLWPAPFFLPPAFRIQSGPFPAALLSHEYWVRVSPSYTNSDCDNIQAYISQVSRRCSKHSNIFNPTAGIQASLFTYELISVSHCSQIFLLLL